MREVIVLQHAAPEGPGAIATALAARGIGCRVVRPYEGEPVPASVRGMSGLVVMGGPMGVHDVGSHPHLRDEVRLIGEAIQAGLPVLGVCLGSQLIAHALGAEVSAGPGKELGFHEVTLTGEAAEDPLFAGAPPRFEAFHWHGDRFALPADAVGLASSRLTPWQAFRYGDHVWAVLFHLEVDLPAVEAMVAVFGAELDEVGGRPDRVLADAERCVPALRRVGDLVLGRFAERVGARG